MKNKIAVEVPGIGKTGIGGSFIRVFSDDIDGVVAIKVGDTTVRVCASNLRWAINAAMTNVPDYESLHIPMFSNTADEL